MAPAKFFIGSVCSAVVSFGELRAIGAMSSGTELKPAETGIWDGLAAPGVFETI